MHKLIIDHLFTDETELFRSPVEPDAGDLVKLRLRSDHNSIDWVRLMVDVGGNQRFLTMIKSATDAFFDWYETSLICSDKQLRYIYLINADGQLYVYDKLGPRSLPAAEKPDLNNAFWLTPGFHVPAWTKGAVQYQIFTDRFCNGDRSNDVNNNEYYYINGHAWHMPWEAPTVDPDIHNFYGGDLQGVIDKLDYLQDLGVDVLYFNPLFVSPSSHKYDTQDYEHIDPHFGVIIDDERHPMEGWEHHNGYASEYICRTTSLKNLEASDALFATLCQKLHQRGMKIILDGVFNHCGSFNKWMDREGIYVGKKEYEKGAFQSKDSPYRQYFHYYNDSDYEGWWNLETMPKLNYDESSKIKEVILQIAEKWAKPPYSIDGWRLDVAADLGHSPEVNHEFWREFRRRLKAVNPNLLIVAEHYGDASSWLQGDQWDTVMNYDAFMEPVTYFLTGMEKHSDYYNPQLYQNGEAFFELMARNRAKLQETSLTSAMNELSNHDHSRFLTRTNRRVGRLVSAGSEAAGEGVDKRVMVAAVTIQMTWPGAPTLYYGDEAGQVGWTDPDCRRTYPWGHEDEELLNIHRRLIAIHKHYPLFTYGSLKDLKGAHGLVAYARFDERQKAVVIINNLDEERMEHIDLRSLGIVEGSAFVVLFNSAGKGEREYIVEEGGLNISLGPHWSLILYQA